MTNPAASPSSSPDLSSKGRLNVLNQQFTQADSVAPQPLSPEVRGLSSNFSTRQDLIDVVEKSMEGAKNTDLKKLRIYEIALKILTIIGMAIFFAVPICMLLGVPLWIPIVACIGAGIVLSIAKGCLQKRCQQIRQEYRALHLYYCYLLSNKDSIDGSLLSRYNICLRKAEEKLHGVFPEERAPNHPLSADKKYDFAGLAHQRYQVDAAIGIPSVQDTFWRAVAQQVKSVKDEIIAGKKTSADLELVSEQALLVGGVDVSAAKDKASLMDITRSLLNMLAWGACVGKEARETVQRYQMRFLNSPLMADWCGANLSSSAQDFLVDGQNLLEIASKHHTKVQSAVEQMWLVPVLGKVRNWRDQIKQLPQHKTQVDSLWEVYRNIEQLMHEICIEEGISPSIQRGLRTVTNKYLRGDLQKLFAKEESSLKEEEFAAVYESICSCADFVVSLLEGHLEVFPTTSMQNIEKSVYQRLLQAVVPLGGNKFSKGRMTTHIDNICKVVRSGQALHKELGQVMKSHPEHRFHKLLSTAEKLQAFISNPKWGASAVHLSPQDSLEQKQKFAAVLQGIQTRLAEWRDRYGVFKETKLNLIVSTDFTNETGKLLSKCRGVVDSCSLLGTAVQYLDDCEHALHADLGNIGKIEDSKELASVREEFNSLVSELSNIQGQLEQISLPIYEEGMSGQRLLLNTMLSSPVSLQKKILEKGAALEDLATTNRLENTISSKETTLEMVSHGYEHLSRLLGEINSFEDCLEKSQNGNITTNTMQQLIKRAGGLALMLSSFTPDSMTGLLDRLEELSTETLPVLEKSDTSSAVSAAEGIAQASYQRVNGVARAKANRTLNAFTKLIKDLRASLRNSMITKAIIGAVLSIAFSCLAIALFSVQLTWLPIVFCVLALGVEVIPSLLSTWINQRNWKLEVASLAKQLASDNRKLPYPQQDVQDIKKLEKLRNIYGLDGLIEFRVAEAALLAAQKLPEEQKQETLQSTVKALRADAKALDKAFQQLPKEYQSLFSKKATKASLKKSTTEKTSSSLEREVAAIEARQDEYHAACLQFESMNMRFLAEQRKAKSLESLLTQKRKGMVNIDKKESLYNEIISRLKKIVVRKEGVLAKKVSREELSTKVRALLDLDRQLTKAYEDRNVEESNKAHRNMQAMFSKLAEEGNLQEVKDLLELDMCLGNTEQGIYYTEQGRVLGTSVIRNPQQLLQYGESLFASYDKEENIPLLRFVLGAGWRVTREACAELKHLYKRLQQDPSQLSPEDYSNTYKTLRRFLKAREDLRPDLRLPFKGGEFDICVQQQILNNQRATSQIASSYQECCRDVLLHLEDWVQKTRNESVECRNVEARLDEFCQKIIPDESLSDAVKALFASLDEDLNKISGYVLYTIVSSWFAKSLRIMERRAEYAKIEESFEKAKAALKEKEAEFEKFGEEWNHQYQLLKMQIGTLESQKENLIASHKKN
ncbi:hypothetical protein [Chlamydia sp.]|uniref:hypothetical protein n=1 Tax=Chlamydia sp. TaxID=35827 RepID=UPI0025B96A9A|nr:hypothetical protein [Chlamydia sp.]MBQ8498195.1 hypothetical protein [Chlamydia sp.]